MRWIDNHCHLDVETADQAIAEARAVGVETLINVGTDVTNTRLAITVAERFDSVWATAGVHPHDADGGIDGLAELTQHERVVAVGECGLDFHYNYSEHTAQKEVFAAQIQLAHESGLTLVIHTREAWDDTFDILVGEGVPPLTIMHCFTGGVAEAERSLALGAYLSFSGIVSFKNAHDVRAAAALCPADRYLVETDAPYLAPVPHRGKPNKPMLLPAVGEALAQARGTTASVVAKETHANTLAAYRLDDLKVT